MVNTWASLVFVALQFYSQILGFRRISGSPGLLSLLSLGIRAVVTVAVAARWFRRLGPPTWEDRYTSPTLWHQGDWPPFNYVIEGIGCAVLVGLYVRAGQMGGSVECSGRGNGFAGIEDGIPSLTIETSLLLDSFWESILAHKRQSFPGQCPKCSEARRFSRPKCHLFR